MMDSTNHRCLRRRSRAAKNGKPQQRTKLVTDDDVVLSVAEWRPVTYGVMLRAWRMGEHSPMGKWSTGVVPQRCYHSIPRQ